ncbi:MAG: DUF4381 domain-containing protein [Thermodesulfobacteriota bacterium]
MVSTSLKDLHDIIPLDPVPWLPPAPGWYALALSLLLALAWSALLAISRWRRNRYRRAALTELKELEQELSRPDSLETALVQLPPLLKRVALAAYGRQATASLIGNQWLAFLNQSVRGRNNFSPRVARTLMACSYGPGKTLQQLSPAEIQDLCVAVRHWIRRHRPEENGRQ